MWERFETTKNGVSWFFEVTVEGSSIYMRNGPVGTKAKTKKLQFATEEKAKKAHEDLISQKSQEGYVFKYGLW